METVVVQVPSPDGGLPTQVVHVQPGQTLSFGRGGPKLDVDIKLPDQGVSRLAGRLTAAEDYWLITNLSSEASYVVDNPEGGGEYITVAPRRLRDWTRRSPGASSARKKQRPLPFETPLPRLLRVSGLSCGCSPTPSARS